MNKNTTDITLSAYFNDIVIGYYEDEDLVKQFGRQLGFDVDMDTFMAVSFQYPSDMNVKPEDREKLLIQIDPGTAFGTGMHETTQLCIRQIKKYVKPDTVLLDVGTGSGILSIAALKLGAKFACGTDVDPCAITAVKENMEVNGVEEDKYTVMLGNIIDDKAVQEAVGYEKYDMVVANILAEVLVPLTPVILAQMKPGALYITSGIIDDKEETVVKAVKAAGLEVLEVNHQGEWVSVTARKRQD